MRICLIAEGSYPYITGGVSSWIQMLISNMPEHEFVVYTIGAETKMQGRFRYKIPDNVVAIDEHFLDFAMQSSGTFGHKYHLKEEEVNNFVALLTGEKLNWDFYFEIIRSKRIKNILDFFMSFDFFEIIKNTYLKKYSGLPFTEFYWNCRSLMFSLLYISQQAIPFADLYHSVSTGYAGVIGSLAQRLYHKPFILTEHGVYSREREEEIIKSDYLRSYFKEIWINLFYNISNLAYQSADKVVSLFNKSREIQIMLGCDQAKTSVIYNGIRVDDYKKITEQTKFKEGQKYFNVGAIIRVVPIKDIKTMLRSFAIVKESLPSSRFYIMGPTDENQEYYEECKNMQHLLGLDDCVVFTGSVNIKEYLGIMDVIVLSSISEGQPLALLEAMAGKKPLVTTDVGACREIIYGDDSYGQAGFVVPIMDFKEMANKIIYLSENETVRQKMGMQGYKRVSELYTIDSFINKYKELYTSLAGR